MSTVTAANLHIVPGYSWIVIDPALLAGQPTILGTRISVAHILESLAGGVPIDEIVEDYGVPREAIPEALKFAASLASEPRRVAS